MKFLKCSEGAIPPSTGKRVAIVGAGPAGLGAAGVLRCKGHEVHVYDSLQEPGGMLIFAIPEYHVPKAGVRSGVQELVRAGVNFHMRTRVVGCSEPAPREGASVRLEDLVRDFDAVLIATGTWRSRRLEVPGEDLPGVYVALDWLFEFYQAQLGYRSMDEVPPLGRRVMVVGGGLTAVDAAEVPLRYLRDRFGIQKVYLSYRRTRNEAPMSVREFNRLIQQYGVEPLELTVPVRFSAGPEGRVASATLQRMRLESVPGRQAPPPGAGAGERVRGGGRRRARGGGRAAIAAVPAGLPGHRAQQGRHREDRPEVQDDHQEGVRRRRRQARRQPLRPRPEERERCGGVD
jgi:sulfide dehydrogenase (flavoprotein) subunit SudA (EC 1.97.-.-)